jgi:hypothetical protein
MQAIANNLPGKGICNKREVSETIGYPDIGNVADPDLVDPGQNDAFDQIAILEEWMRRVSSNGLSLLLPD